MPTYEYRCKSCGDTFEIMQRLADRPLRKCRKCSGRLEKLVSRSSFLLKGGGWYSEGYGPSKKPDEAKASGGEEKPKKEKAATESKSEKGESKSEKKKPT